ncbi:MAG: FecR domain-containing protein, partial [Xanthobacteraceae bacterium]|nr:FecR domain-containing protein [Xanthobacteraceae bacterium]
MNYAGTFGNAFSDDGTVSLTDHLIKGDSGVAPAAHDAVAHDTIVIPDVQLLFTGDFNRLGSDLVLSKDGHEYVVPDYFRGEKRASLASPDGASLSGKVVEAMTGHVQYAQADSTPSAARDIGQIAKLAGTVTAIRNGVTVELHSGDRVYKGDVVQAGPDSSVSITFIDGSVFGLSSNARMVLNEMVYDQAGTSNSALISLVRGTITFVAGETAKHGDMKVDTPVATMGIRGTAVLVEIGFEIPSDGTAPPVNFQVLVERDGHTGSYLLFSKSDPTVMIGTVDKSGQVYSFSANGSFSSQAAGELTPIAKEIIGYALAG